MRAFVLLYWFSIQLTIVYSFNQYLGCFIDQIDNRDLDVFIGNFDRLTPTQCSLACQERNYLFAAIQYGSECRCGQRYGIYGQVSDDECRYTCSTTEKCGGDNRNSIYSVMNSIDLSQGDSTCQNTVIGYQGCFNADTLSTDIGVVNSIEECVTRCASNYDYAGVMNGNLCYCGNALEQPSINSHVCHIPCNISWNDMIIDCCGGVRVLSVYNLKYYQSPLADDLSKRNIRVRRAGGADSTSSASSQDSTPSTTVMGSSASVTTTRPGTGSISSISTVIAETSPTITAPQSSPTGSSSTSILTLSSSSMSSSTSSNSGSASQSSSGSTTNAATPSITNTNSPSTSTQISITSSATLPSTDTTRSVVTTVSSNPSSASGQVSSSSISLTSTSIPNTAISSTNILTSTSATSISVGSSILTTALTSSTGNIQTGSTIPSSLLTSTNIGQSTTNILATTISTVTSSSIITSTIIQSSTGIFSTNTITSPQTSSVTMPLTSISMSTSMSSAHTDTSSTPVISASSRSDTSQTTSNTPTNSGTVPSASTFAATSPIQMTPGSPLPSVPVTSQTAIGASTNSGTVPSTSGSMTTSPIQITSGSSLPSAPVTSQTVGSGVTNTATMSSTSASMGVSSTPMTLGSAASSHSDTSQSMGSVSVNTATISSASVSMGVSLTQTVSGSSVSSRSDTSQTIGSSSTNTATIPSTSAFMSVSSTQITLGSSASLRSDTSQTMASASVNTATISSASVSMGVSPTQTVSGSSVSSHSDISQTMGSVVTNTANISSTSASQTSTASNTATVVSSISPSSTTATTGGSQSSINISPTQSVTINGGQSSASVTQGSIGTTASSTLTTGTVSVSQTGGTFSATVSTQSLTITVANSVASTVASTTMTTTPPTRYALFTVFTVLGIQNFNVSSDADQQMIRNRLIQIITLAFRCLTDSSIIGCIASTRRVRRDACPFNYSVTFISNVAQVPANPSRYIVNYFVTNLCSSNPLVSASEVQAAVDRLPESTKTTILGFPYVGSFSQPTTSTNTTTPAPTDRKLWLIGAILGPIAFVALLIGLCCYLHFKCRPRTVNRSTTQAVYNAPQLSARATNYQSIPDESPRRPAPPVHNVRMLTQSDLTAGHPKPPKRLPPLDLQQPSSNLPEYPVSVDIPMQEIRHQNDVERWRNKLRLQEKFEQRYADPLIDLDRVQNTSSARKMATPSPPRSASHSHDNIMYEPEPPNDFLPSANEHMSMYEQTRSARRMPQASDIEVGRTKLHRLLDEVLDKADVPDAYDPDSDLERQKRRRQRRRLHSNMQNHQNPLVHSDNEQIRHTPIIAQVTDRPDPSLLRTRYNPYEAGDRAYDIERAIPVEFTPKYAADDNEIRSRYGHNSVRSNPPVFYDDAPVADRAMLRRSGQRSHAFGDDAVYIDTIAKNNNGSRPPVRNAWTEDNGINNLESHFHINSSDMHSDPTARRNDYRDEYMMAKRSVASTKNLISSIHDELQHIVSDSTTDHYHA